MHNYEKLKKNKANWIVVAVIVLVAIISLIGWSNYRSHHLAGTYTNQATFLGVTSKTKLEFSNDKKVKMTNGTTSENDTYELSGNDLKIKNEDDEVIMRAKLADDRKSFKVKSIAGDILILCSVLWISRILKRRYLCVIK